MNKGTQTPLRFYSIDYFFRLAAVYIYGYFVCEFLLHVLQDHAIITFSPLSPLYIFPILSGFAAVLMGIMYPLLDCWFYGKPLKKGWHWVLRCCGGFLGVSYAACVC